MKKILYNMLVIGGALCIITACSNGAYTANPDGNANKSINPLNPLTSSQFTWGGSDPVSADINGSHFVADTAGWYLDSSGTNVIYAATNDGKGFVFYLNGVYAVNLYSLSYHIYNTQIVWSDSLGEKNTNDYFFSYLGNSGEVKIVENDSAYIKGLFYFQGVAANGKLVTVNNGYFNIAKPIVP